MDSVAAWHGDGLARRFCELHEVLRRFEPLWRPQAFQHPTLAWEATFPKLSAQLRALDRDRAEALAEDDRALVELLREHLPELPALHASLVLPAMTLAPLLDGPRLPEAVGVPGRKWRQIQAFASCVPLHAVPLLEWCAGKAHLGRLLARLQRRATTALERNHELVASGEQLARREGLPVEFRCVDVLDEATVALVQREQDIVALHACGELHLQLLRNCATRQPRALVLAPCCYQLIASDHYLPLSRMAKASDLQLTTADLHTAVRDSVTSPRRVREQRRTLQAWRLGFDSWQRGARGIDTYLPTPSLPLSVLNEGFEVFCRELATKSGIAFDAAVDCEYIEAEGWRRLGEVAALDLARIVFRRALELWLVLDRALYLQENGYSVELGTFCERELTPRNVLIRARRCADQ